ncbi:hypothetical protein CONLIGDRAFT_21301 [Coniochaeta ligniaria NRRL 30616]|uniref:Homeobox domain-containing protein n=1 Tax=Coniochaeta ligniaria NRRL 30616 TaxID=1408157 RepID=A0A1J7JZ97_9PEZI|nr:hypothetical protein CONLIGDRAFT_21301 [Coniochaeta ligniaria NRRL 30616]
MDSPEMFDSPFFGLDNSMPTHAAFDSSAHNQLQVPRQAFMPFTQQAYSHSYAHRPSRQPGSYPSSPSWQHHSRQHQHALPQYGNHYTFGVRHHPFALTHALQAKTTAETKARLDKKHVEILEHEFSKNQKPSSIIKRELAEQMGHEIARINNWFQNRRAKEKSNKRTAEYAAREANRQRDSSEGASSGPQSPEQHDEDDRDKRSVLDNIQRPIMSSATIGEVEPEDNGPLEQQQPHLVVSDETPDDASQRADDDMSNSDSGNNRLTVVISHDMPDHHDAREHFQSPIADLKQEFDYPALQEFHGLPHVSNNLEYLDDNEIATAWFHPLPQAPSDYFGSDVAPLSLLNAGAPMAMTEQQFPSEDILKGQQLASPVSMSSMSQTPPPAKDMGSRFALKSPRPINIAARRNHQRPAPLGLAISRKASYCQGPKTGIDLPRHRGDDTTPMRRTASATGLHDRHGLPYANFNAPMATRFENSINTPPVTPGLPLGYSSFANPFEQAWAHAANDQPLATPSLCSHGGSEMDFPGTSHMPSYIASQPATPGFQRPDAFGPGFRFVQGGMSNAPEYTFPDSSYVESSLGSSPHEQPMSKTFQFAQNVTPQDFSHEN